MFRPRPGALTGMPVSVDRQGIERPITDRLKVYANPGLSPDGRRLAITIGDSNRSSDVWVYELEPDIMTRLTSGPTAEFDPFWTPAGGASSSSLRVRSTICFGKRQMAAAPRNRFSAVGTTNPGSVSDGKTLAYANNILKPDLTCGFYRWKVNDSPSLFCKRHIRSTVLFVAGWPLASLSIQSVRPV